ncbi:acyl-CoA N-acyltransferase [Heliocybe sulcata]|uniref:Acyl-CoA N-acyltransferase n=1 Tax=Heliocybe sulcata TaxID=5364 RepID=A0A5C3MRW4_9AGAM|nr:acyl-CoA N-acyltransferase [Heliocybe sulcata]
MPGAFVNLYKPPAKHLPDPTYGTDPYDLNFVFPIKPEILENDKLQLTPFIPALHAEGYWTEAHPTRQPGLYDYLPWSPQSLDEFLSLVERYRQDPTGVLFAILDKTRQGQPLAGIIGVIRCDPRNLVAEIGAIIVFPAFQRSHVASNAIGLAMRYCLDLQTASPPGLGLRRVIWATAPENVASNKGAQKMAMKQEVTCRWNWLLAPGKGGGRDRPGDPRPGVDMVLYAMCWDDWESAGREAATKVMDRR